MHFKPDYFEDNIIQILESEDFTSNLKSPLEIETYSLLINSKWSYTCIALFHLSGVQSALTRFPHLPTGDAVSGATGYIHDHAQGHFGMVTKVEDRVHKLWVARRQLYHCLFITMSWQPSPQKWPDSMSRISLISCHLVGERHVGMQAGCPPATWRNNNTIVVGISIRGINSEAPHLKCWTECVLY